MLSQRRTSAGRRDYGSHMVIGRADGRLMKIALIALAGHFVLLGRVFPLLRARKVSAGAGFAASVVPCATTVANSAITDGNVRRLQKPVCDRHRIDERTEPHVPS